MLALLVKALERTILPLTLPSPDLSILLSQRAASTKQVFPSIIQEAGSRVQIFKHSFTASTTAAQADPCRSRLLVDVKALPELVALEKPENTFGAREETAREAVADARSAAEGRIRAG
jgi:hypothetical protein